MGIFFNENDYTNSNEISLETINEVYFGNNNKELEELQNQFSKFRQAQIGKGVFNTSINQDPELLKFNRMIEDFFGFEAFALVIEPNMTNNAYTVPLSYRIDVGNTSKHLIKTKNGFKYDKKIGYSCMVFMHSNLIIDTSDKFTDREVFAIFLHEIGHNFQQNFDGTTTVAGFIYKLLNLVQLPLMIIYSIIDPLGTSPQVAVGSINGLNKYVIKKADKIKKQNPDLNKVFYIFKSIKGILEGVLTNIMFFLSYIMFFCNPVQSVVNIIYRELMRLSRNPLSIIFTIFGYRGEKLSDEFATFYGYGPDLSSALGKIEYDHGTGYVVMDTFTQIPFLNNIYDVFMLPVLFLLNPFEPHPETVARANNQLKYLQNEVKSSKIDPKMKKQIEKDINMIEKNIEKMTKSTTDDSQSVRKAYAAFMLHASGGDIRELFNKNKPIGKYDKYLETPISKVKIK